MDVQGLLLRIINISPSAREYIDGSQSLLNTDEDETSISTLMLGATDKLILDISELGIELTCTREDLCSTVETITYLIELGEIICPQPLYELLKANANVRTAFSNIMEGSISNEYRIIAILQYFGYYDETYMTTCGPMVHFFEDKIQSTELFNTYLASMLNVDNKIANMMEIDVKMTGDYIKYMSDIISRMYNRLTEVTEKTSDELTFRNLSRVIHKAAYLFMDPTNLNKYGWTFLNRNADLGEFETFLRDKYMDEVSKTSPFFTAYYLAQNLAITNQDILLIILYASACNSQLGDYISMTDAIRKMLEETQQFTPGKLTYFNNTVILVKEISKYE